MKPQPFPKVGDAIVIKKDEDEARDVPEDLTVVGFFGAARLFAVLPTDAPKGSRWWPGIVAIQPDGTSYWVRDPVEREPWEPDA